MVAMHATFGRVLTAMVTPFHDDGSLDLEGARELARFLTGDGGNDGLVIAGTTGESPTLSQDEQIDLIEAVVDAVVVRVDRCEIGEGKRLHRADVGKWPGWRIYFLRWVRRAPQNAL